MLRALFIEKVNDPKKTVHYTGIKESKQHHNNTFGYTNYKKHKNDKILVNSFTK